MILSYNSYNLQHNPFQDLAPEFVTGLTPHNNRPDRITPHSNRSDRITPHNNRPDRITPHSNRPGLLTSHPFCLMPLCLGRSMWHMMEDNSELTKNNSSCFYFPCTISCCRWEFFLSSNCLNHN
jgi:hypothetical protein